MKNPFEITKAVDLSDDEIERTFVSFNEKQVSHFVDPRSPMPQFLVGAKGGGRTHLLRHLAGAGMRRPSLEKIGRQGYVGVYFRCSGLNGSRFRGGAADEAGWTRAFAWYMDLWLSERLLRVLDPTLRGGIREALGRAIFARLEPLLGLADHGAKTFEDVLTTLAAMRQGVDKSVNNAPIRRRLEIDVLTAPGELLFAVAASVPEAIETLRRSRVTFLVDEFENLSKDQQRYFNTLIREKEPPVSFIIGGREWGIKTQETLSGGEENKRGSEYELTVLEDRYRNDLPAYTRFCNQMLDVRARDEGIDVSGENVLELLAARAPAQDDRWLPATGQHLKRLKDTLVSLGLQNADIEAVLASLEIPGREFYSRLALLKFYLTWSDKGAMDLPGQARVSRELIEQLLRGDASADLVNFRNLRRADIEAQMFLDAGRPLPYLGPEALIQMSGFLPRNLIMTMKYVTQWALFFSEDPFEDGLGVSVEAQAAGVREAARWFYQDSRPMGSEGREAEEAVRRFGNLLQEIRRSDKPSEVSLSSFSSNLKGLSVRGLEVLELCLRHGMLVEIPSGRSARNSGPQHRKFQLHPMIAPLFGVSTARRGDLTLSGAEVTAIFDPEVSEEAYLSRVRRRVAPMNAPFTNAVDDAQVTLFD